jgi:integrase
VLALYRTEPAAAFSPLKLKAVRETLVARDLARTYVNQLVACIVRVWKWLAAEELVPAATWQALAAVPGLKRSRTTARESEPIEPAPELAIDATKELLLPPVRAMVDLQLLTAMRPGEACQLRPADLERDGPAGCWIYRPAEHKTEHHGRSRLVLIGPRAQALLTPFLFRAPDVFCFSPREAVEYALHGYNQPGERYTRESYCRAIARACVRAGCAHWHPNQLRHNAATRLREQFGWDVARIILGHSTVTTTAIYAADSLERAAQAMREAG